MIVRDILNVKELEYCLDMYYKQNDHSFVKIDKDFCLANITVHWRSKEFFKVLVKDNIIVGFLMATTNKNRHCKESFLLQEYYTSTLKGFGAAKAVYILHDALIEVARKRKISLVVSCGSHLDETNTFTKLLERNGWKRRGYVATFSTKQTFGNAL